MRFVTEREWLVVVAELEVAILSLDDATGLVLATQRFEFVGLSVIQLISAVVALLVAMRSEIIGAVLVAGLVVAVACVMNDSSVLVAVLDDSSVDATR